ncbi:histidine phosphatase family protein [Shewanella sp. D64]|uniref:histidine phosphatase family protein n=1 Tax=unclassified Shewanella TaxID=196818 RepID=UPI0022BA2961|nr:MULTISPECIES: histidine phosphatase family protein [unclassified Shewanella]MEC4724943.1 histidine phosphatase family protein [Shewanella sp. D64]MEC4736844.1 histidine phosphatase family protein [Shewanella sp. E94]WBJ96443.1 histidine phosphatase family protein [Shewanella sp. MTB7]
MINSETQDWSNGKTTTLYLMRHGECEGGQILRGQTDVALSDTGKVQMKRAIGQLNSDLNSELNSDLNSGLDLEIEIVFEQVICSPLRRCSEFALSLYLEKGIPLKMEDGLKEIDFGDWDGETLDSLYQTSADMIEMYWKNPWAFTPPNGESMQAFEARVNQSWDSILSQYSGQTLLLVTHGGVIRHLMSRALGVTGVVGFYTQLALAYASIVKITVYTSAQGEHFTKLHWD